MFHVIPSLGAWNLEFLFSCWCQLGKVVSFVLENSEFVGLFWLPNRPLFSWSEIHRNLLTTVGILKKKCSLLWMINMYVAEFNIFLEIFRGFFNSILFCQYYRSPRQPCGDHHGFVSGDRETQSGFLSKPDSHGVVPTDGRFQVHIPIFRYLSIKFWFCS